MNKALKFTLIIMILLIGIYVIYNWQQSYENQCGDNLSEDDRICGDFGIFHITLLGIILFMAMPIGILFSIIEDKKLEKETILGEKE